MNTTFRKLTPAWPLAMFLLLPALTRAETAVQAWVQRFNGPGNGNDWAQAVVVDSSNDVIVTGCSTGSTGDFDYALIKYSSAGAPLWTNRYNGPGNGYDRALAMVVDSTNDVIVTGRSTGSESDYDYATIKYSSAGVPLWTNRYNGPGNGRDCGRAMSLGRSNDVIVTGDSYANGSSSDYATIKYSSGGVPLWTNRYNGPGNGDDWAYAVTADGSNNFIVTGESYANGSSPDYATIKYSSGGVPLWTNRYNGPGNGYDRACALAVDGSNNVIVTGYSAGIGTSFDYTTIKHSSGGVPLWTNLYGRLQNSSDYAGAMAVDASNNVIVTGFSYDSSFTNSVCVTVKYSSAGVPLWTNLYNGPGYGFNGANHVAVDGGNQVIVAAQTGGAIVADQDYTTIKYSSTGVPLWTNLYNGPGNANDSALALAVDRTGNVIVTGASAGSGCSDDYTTIKYICVPSPVVTGLQLSNGAFQLQVDEVLQPGTLVIEACTNLLDWSPVFTNTTPTNVLFYTAPDAGNSPARFYRAFQFP